MLERPALSDAALESVLLTAYGLTPQRIEFLPIGNDASAYVFRADCSGETYFLKLKTGEIYLPSVLVPRHLRDIGITQVLAPIPTRAGLLFTPVERFNLILYPFIEGCNAMDTGMSEAQWLEFGSTLKRIHTTLLPSGLSNLLLREDFRLNPRCLGIAKKLQEALPPASDGDIFAQELAEFWLSRQEEIAKILVHAQEIGRRMQGNPLEFILCHRDIHTANIMLDGYGRMAIIDWDQPILAPKERDLMFIEGGREGQLFYQGYGSTEPDPLALAYYAYEWVVQEIGDYAERVFFSSAYGEETRRDSVRGFKQLFNPGDVVDAAYAAASKINI